MKILVLRVALPEHFLACSSRGIGNLMIQCQSHQKIEHEEHAARSPAQLPQAANTQASRHILVSNAHPPPTPLATSYRIQPQHSCDFRATSHSSVPTASKSTPSGSFSTVTGCTLAAVVPLHSGTTGTVGRCFNTGHIKRHSSDVRPYSCSHAGPGPRVWRANPDDGRERPPRPERTCAVAARPTPSRCPSQCSTQP